MLVRNMRLRGAASAHSKASAVRYQLLFDFEIERYLTIPTNQEAAT